MPHWSVRRTSGCVRQACCEPWAQRARSWRGRSVAGLLASSGAAGIGWALAHYVFDFEWSFSPWLWIAGAGIGMACAVFGGWAGLRSVLARPPLQTLREA